MKNYIILAVVALAVYFLFFHKKKASAMLKGDITPAPIEKNTKPFQQEVVRPVPKPIIANQTVTGTLSNLTVS